MRSTLPSQTLRNVCALVAVTLIPALAYAGTDNGKGNNGQNNGQQNGHKIPVVPEANPALVLVPFFGAVLLFASRNLFAKSEQGQRLKHGQHLARSEFMARGIVGSDYEKIGNTAL